MKKVLVLLGSIVSVVVLNTATGLHEQEKSPAEKVRVYILAELEHARAELASLPVDAKEEAALHYINARKHYKHVEFFVEYYSPREAKYFINGPLVPKHDPEQGPDVFYPQGFQRIEELIYDNEAADTARLRSEIRMLNEQLVALTTYYRDVAIEDGLLLELCQLQLFRLASLNLNGYDATISLDGISESACSVEGLQVVVGAFDAEAELHGREAKKIHAQLRKELSAAEKDLARHPDYNRFNRLEFIVAHINPLNKLLVEFHKACGYSWNGQKQALNLQEPFLFGEESFNMRFFSMYYDDTLHLVEQAELGKKLFHDPELSGNGVRSCSSCHQPERTFQDGVDVTSSLDGGAQLARNTPTLKYVAFQKSFFYDGRAYQLEQQVSDVVHNPVEMNGSLEKMVERLRANENYRREFAAAFAGTPDSGITTYAIQKCITEYEKTLAGFNSRFDRYLRGDRSAMNAREVNGYNLFAGKALCGSCHFFPLFNGTVPPFFSDSEFEVIGTPSDSTNRWLDNDDGRFFVTGKEEHRRAFKTPTLRNIAFTAPYMHNGIYSSLPQVVDFYRRGGGGGMGLGLENQTLPFDSLQLNTREQEDIVMFMKTLGDE